MVEVLLKPGLCVTRGSCSVLAFAHFCSVFSLRRTTSTGQSALEAMTLDQEYVLSMMQC